MLIETASLINKLNQYIQESPNGMDSLRQVCREVQCTTHASSVTLIDMEGRILISENAERKGIALPAKSNDGYYYLDHHFNDQLKNTVEIKRNLSLSHFSLKNFPKEECENGVIFILPVVASMERLATLFMYKDSEFTQEDAAITELCLIVIALTIKQLKLAKHEEESNRLSIVKSAIDALSYSELEAILHIFDALNDNDGLVVASKVASAFKLTRSVIINALRKLESAGIIESRSLGMKGTYIKIKNPLFVGELNKLKT